jgi:hypothetical protein
MNTVDVLARLTDHYAGVPAPAPSAELLRRMDAGRVGIDDDRDRGAVVIPFTVRPPVRMRHLVAAMVATFVVFSGLAVAGALPDPIQRGVASVVSHVGIDLPEPQAPATRSSHGGSNAGSSSPTASGAATSPGRADRGSTNTPTSSKGGGSAASSSSTTTVPGAPGPGGVPSVPTTLPVDPSDPSAAGGELLPPLSLPPITLPPVSLPPISLPPISLPPISLPPISLPPISLPPLSLPPLLPLGAPSS